MQVRQCWPGTDITSALVRSLLDEAHQGTLSPLHDKNGRGQKKEKERSFTPIQMLHTHTDRQTDINNTKNTLSHSHTAHHGSQRTEAVASSQRTGAVAAIRCCKHFELNH